MFLRIHGEMPVHVIVRKTTEDRLNGTCFRGQPIERAGNFMMWSSMNELLCDPLVRPQFIAEVSEILLSEVDVHEDGSSEQISFTIDVERPIGWSSTESADHFTNLSELEIFQPNRHSLALRVRREENGRKAPLTSLVTFVCECKYENDIATAIIHSVYPGDDIGRLDGDLLVREHIVFYDWDHPGRPL